MKIKELLNSNFKACVSEITEYYLSASNNFSIWGLAEKGIFNLFKADKEHKSYLNSFSDEVRAVIFRRREKLKGNFNNTGVVGKYLIFDPTTTMYDGLAEDSSLGFF